jgi:molybdate transport system ATP-binding protein
MAELKLDVRLERAGFRLEVRETLRLAGITVLFGPSGSGKTTLLRIVAGLDDGAAGDVAFDGSVWQRGRQKVPAHRRRIGYVFQDGRLFGHLSVEDNLRYGLRRAGRGGGKPIELGAVVAALDLAPLLQRRPASLSGGEQQRVAIGRALLTTPRLLLMDEPLSALDIGRKREILPHIERLPSEFGVPVLYVTHNIDEVARLATDVVLLAAGRVTARGPVGEILERVDLSPFTGGHEAGAVLSVRVTGSRDGIATLQLGEQSLRVPMSGARVGTMVRLRIHARDVALATELPRRLSIRNVLRARILRIAADTGAYADLLLTVDGQHLRARITRDALEDLALDEDQDVYALVKSVALESTLLA